MKTLYFDTSFLESVGNGPNTGIPRVVNKLLDALIEHQTDDLKIVCVVWDDWQNKFLLDKNPIQLSNDSIYFCPQFAPNFSDGYKAALNDLRRRNTSVWMLMHDLMPLNKDGIFDAEEFGRIPPSYFAHIIKNAAAYNIITVSETVCKELKSYLKSIDIDTTVQWIRLGSDIGQDKTTHIRPEDQQVIDKIANKPTFLSVSSIKPRKGFLELVDEFTKLWDSGFDCCLVIAGIPDGLYSYIPDKIKANKYYNDRLFLLECPSDEVLDILYSKSICYITASKGEGFGLTVVEAHNHGVPVIARDLEVFHETTQDKNIRYFNKDEDISKVVKEFINDPIVFNPNEVVHLTWKQSADLFKKRVLDEQEANPKNGKILFFTTMHKAGWKLYGRDWLKSIISNVIKHNPNIHARIFCDGFDLPAVSIPNITFVKYNEAVKYHEEWKHDFRQQSTHGPSEKDMSIVFSHKAFVIQHVLDTEQHDTLIWTDGDVIFKPDNYIGFPNFLEDKLLACQIENNHTKRNVGLNHIESGIVVFNNRHPDIKKFNDLFKRNYTPEEMNKIEMPFDGYVLYKTIKEFDVVDLNKDVDLNKIVGRPDLTFLHPEISKKFIHNIGWDGKIKYSGWKEAIKEDAVFRGIDNHMVNVEGCKRE